MAGSGDRWTFWSRALSLPGTVKGLISAMAALVAIAAKRFFGALTLPLAYQLALTTTAGVFVLSVGLVAASIIVPKLPSLAPKVELQLMPIVAARNAGILS